MMGDAEAGAHGAGDQAGAGGGADEGEGGEGDVHDLGMRAGIHDDIDLEIFHGGVEVFFDDVGHAVDFIDEEDVAMLEVGEDAHEVGGADEGGAGGDFWRGTVHFVGDDVGEGGFAQAGGAGEEDVLHRFFAVLGGFDGDADALDEFGLADVVVEFARAEGGVEVGAAERFVFGLLVGGDDAFTCHGNSRTNLNHEGTKTRRIIKEKGLRKKLPTSSYLRVFVVASLDASFELVDGAEDFLGVFEGGVDLAGALDPVFGFGAAFAEFDEGFDGQVLMVGELGDGDGVAGGGTDGEAVYLAVEFGDDGFGGAFADGGEAGEFAGVFQGDGGGDLAGGDGQGAEGLAGADAFDGGEEVEKFLVFDAEEAEHFWGELAEGGVAFQILKGEKGDGLADLGLEEGEVGGGDEQLAREVAGGADGDVDAVGADEFEFAGEFYNHGDILCGG